MMGLKAVTYAEDRLEYFKGQLAHAERVLNWWIAHSKNPENHAEKGRAVSYYQDIVKMLKESKWTL